MDVEFIAQFKTSKTLAKRQREMKKRMQKLQKSNPVAWAETEKVDAYYLRSLKKYIKILKAASSALYMGASFV